MKKMKRTHVLAVAAALLLNAMPAIPAQAAAEAPKGMKKAAENEYLTLYINEKDTSLAVVDNATGEVWYTNPPEEDSSASAYYQRLMKSQLQVQ